MISGTNIEAEMDILSVVLNTPEVLLEYSDKWRDSLFSDPFHRKLVDTIKENTIEGIPIEISTLSNNRNEQDQIRSIKLRDKDPQFFDVFYNVLEECMIHRELNKIKNEIGFKLEKEQTLIPSELLHKVKIDLDGLDEVRATTIYKVDEVVDVVVDRYLQIYELAQSGEPYVSDHIIETPIAGMNKLLKRGGFVGGDVIIVAAPPSTGKSEFALNILHHNVKNCAKSGFIYSLEMKKESLLERVLLAESGVDSFKLERGKLTDADLLNLKNAANTLKGLNLFFEDNISGDIFDILTSIRKAHAKNKLDFVVIDYIQLIKYPLNAGTRNDEVSSISRLLKQEAMRLNIPFIILSQISRRPLIEGREPNLHDLRDSGAIEQDADDVIFLHATLKERKKEFKCKTKLILAKQREGSTGEVYTENRKTIQTFVEIKESEYNSGSRNAHLNNEPEEDQDLPF